MLIIYMYMQDIMCTEMKFSNYEYHEYHQLKELHSIRPSSRNYKSARQKVYTNLFSINGHVQQKKFKMPPSGGGYLKSLYMKLEDIASRHHPENMICPGIYHLLNLESKKKGTPRNILIGQILPAVWIRWSVSSSQFFCHSPISVRPSQSRIKGKVRPTE